MLLNKINQKHKLIITIVKKGIAKKVVNGSKKAGAEGGTVLLGRGTGVHENKSFLGIPITPEKEIVFTLAKNELIENIIESIIRESKLENPGTGLGIVLNTKSIIGICHLLGGEIGSAPLTGGVNMPMESHGILYDLIVTIVNKGDSDKVVTASKKAGAEGGTILTGRGTGIHEQAKFLNITIEPEKEVVLTLIDRNKTDDVLGQINEDAGLNQPGKGIAFVLEVERTIGINHILNQMVRNRIGDTDA
ncbi:PII family protein [Evansella sp. AB-P1]|uniref:P-II family nitrogen regulator n=1 Tax=Evansella sp. AB-P1 TaxID=3037653 RepID=UPI00241D30CD|nr:P-II family nitrogen regulator [Evansella sp. AB-P1]MDG5786324.1 PII family protein [Evansella sp. AB-P1]